MSQALFYGSERSRGTFTERVCGELKMFSWKLLFYLTPSHYRRNRKGLLQRPEDIEEPGHAVKRRIPRARSLDKRGNARAFPAPTTFYFRSNKCDWSYNRGEHTLRTARTVPEASSNCFDLM